MSTATKNAVCNHCTYKLVAIAYQRALFEKSASFRWLHNQINPIFNKLIAGIVTGEERRSAGVYAKAVSEGSLSEAEIAEWIKGMKTGL